MRITLYETSNDCDALIPDAVRIAKQYAGIDLEITTVKIDPGQIRWTNCGERLNDRTGEAAFYGDIDPEWFKATFPRSNADAVAVYLDPRLWYAERKEPDFLQVGTTVYVDYPAFVFTRPQGSSYRIGLPEIVHPWVWIFLHELSHIFFQQEMHEGDPTHPLDYQYQNLLGAITLWRDPTDKINAIKAKLLAALQQVVPLLREQINFYQSMSQKDVPARLAAWATAIQQHEGWYKGSRSWRNNNPGNLKMTDYVRSLGATGRDTGGFAIFPSADRGFAALEQFLRDAAQGKLIAYHGDPSLRAFYAVYAPSSDKNDPDAYATAVANAIGVSVETHISQLV